MSTDLLANPAAHAAPPSPPRPQGAAVPVVATPLSGLRAEFQRAVLAAFMLGALGVVLVWWSVALHATAVRQAGAGMPLWWPTLLVIGGLIAIGALGLSVWRRAGAAVLPFERLCGAASAGTPAAPSTTAGRWLESIESAGLGRQLTRAAEKARACEEEVANAHNLWNLALVGQTARLRNRAELNAAEARGRRQTLQSLALHVQPPLRSIDDMMGLLLRSRLTPHQLEQAIVARTSARLLLGTLDNHAGRLDRNGVAAKGTNGTVAFDIAEAVEDCVMQFARPAQQMGIELNCRVDAGLPSRVMADPVAVHQAVCALLVQAVSMTCQGSLMVRMRASASRFGERRSLSISVRDSGWSVESAETVVRPGNTSASTGSVAVADELARAAGGVLKVVSFSPQGVALRLELPLELARDDSTETEEPKALASALQSRFRVLVAEQNAAARIVLRHYLNELNMDVMLVADGAQACATIDAAARDGTPFDLVIAEHDLPVVDGPGLAERLARQSRPGHSIRLCLLAPLDGKPAEAGVPGVSVWMPKPLRRSSLRTTLNELLQGVTPNTAAAGLAPGAIESGSAGLADPFVDSDWVLGPANLD